VEGIKTLTALPGAPPVGVYCAITEWNIGSLRQFLRDIGGLSLKEVGFLHNNFVTGEQAHAHNAMFGDSFHATPSNVFETTPSNMDLAQLSEELTEISATSYPFPVRINPRLIEPTEL